MCEPLLTHIGDFLHNSVREVVIKHVAGRRDDEVSEELLTAGETGVGAGGAHTLGTDEPLL